MPRTSPEIFLSAGEVSGDRLASELILQLKKNGFQHFYGVTGEFMRRLGVKTLIPQEKFRVMGLFQVLLKACSIYQIEQQLIHHIQKKRPDLVILIDFPGLHLRLAKQCRDLNIPVFQYVSPKVWAWGKKRIRNLENDYLKVLGVLPFEIDFFQNTRVPYIFVGSPHLKRIDDNETQHSPNTITSPCLAILLGSRRDEITRMLPIVHNTLKYLLSHIPDLRITIPIAANEFENDIKKGLQEYPQITFFNGQSLGVMKNAHAALVNSGTATLECALVGTPMVVCYRMDRLTHWVASKFIQVKWASLVNLILQKTAVPEFIQNFSNKELAYTLQQLLNPESSEAQAQIKSFIELRKRLSPPTSGDAATIITDFLQRH
ncbi:MAG: lipid-A-disaccharide synthase [Oligoflexales bacterium]